MSIDSLTSTSSNRGAHLQQIRKDLSALQSDLQSGNITQAQTDFATLLDDSPKLKASLSSTSATTGSSSAASSASALSTALQSGDVSGATTALTSLQQSLGSAHHHHHHHHSGGGSGSGAVQTDMQTLSSALQSGNLAAAQQALTQLEQDDPALAASPTAPSSSSTGTTLA